MRDRDAPAPIVMSAPPATADIDPRLSHVGFRPLPDAAVIFEIF